MMLRFDRIRMIRRELYKSVLSIGISLLALLIVCIFVIFLGSSNDNEGFHDHSIQHRRIINIFPSKLKLPHASLSRHLYVPNHNVHTRLPLTKCSIADQIHRNISSSHQYNSKSLVINQQCRHLKASDHIHLRHHAMIDSNYIHPITTTFTENTCKNMTLNENMLCFLGEKLCKPGYGGVSCQESVFNPWYSKHCPNLNMTDTLDIHIPLNLTGGEHDPRHVLGIEPKFCSYLCYSHDIYGTAIVPISLWRAAQKAEGDLWQQVAGWSGSIGNANDRAKEHWKAYDNFHCIAAHASLGEVMEVGSGPWTQLKGMLHIRPDITVSNFVIWEPSASRYMKEVSNCAYKTGSKLIKWDGTGYHPFPVEVHSKGGEELLSSERLFDTVITMNVLEHVQDAFEYLTGIYHVLRSGGLLIMHERYYEDKTILDGDKYHPIRIKRYVLDKFFSGFHIIFNNCSAAYEGRTSDRGYYVIAIKI